MRSLMRVVYIQNDAESKARLRWEGSETKCYQSGLKEMDDVAILVQIRQCFLNIATVVGLYPCGRLPITIFTASMMIIPVVPPKLFITSTLADATVESRIISELTASLMGIPRVFEFAKSSIPFKTVCIPNA